MIILLHTSKTMRVILNDYAHPTAPLLSEQAQELVRYMKSLNVEQLAKVMRISTKLAEEVAQKYESWSADSMNLSPAVDGFIGDIYSGLQASSLNDGDRKYANEHLRILSGLYGVLRPLDGISPYRLEMGYRLPSQSYGNLYSFWGDAVAKTLPASGPILNLAAIEYSRLVTPFVDKARIVTPRFLTMNDKTNEPVFVVVHAKIARGAFARWMIKNRIDSIDKLPEFSDIGYRYEASLSTSNEPVFVCDEFGGKGLSVRLERK